MAATLKDVAAAAGVSVKTVSNVVNDYVGVSPRMRARVEQAIAELDYHPNLTARSLRTGRTGIVALAVPTLSEPHFAEVAQCVVSAARPRGWTVLVDPTGGDPGRERWVIDASRPRLLDGVIMSPLGLDDRAISTRDGSLPLVLLGERVSPAAGTDHVAIDNVAAAREASEASEHLLAEGRRRIGVIGVQADRRWATSHLRLRSYREALAAAGSPRTRACSARWTTSTAPPVGRRCTTCSPPAPSLTRCSASTTSSPTARSARSTRPGCGCPRTSRWSASTTTRTTRMRCRASRR